MLKRKKSPLKVFIHVPKTAGSTVNKYLDKSGKPGASHIESWINDNSTLHARLRSLEWVSGHVPFSQMRQELSAATSRPFRFFTLVRDPIKQLMSHYNWLIEIFHRGSDFYEGHPRRIREISEAIRAADNTDPQCIASQIAAAPGLFLNQQSRIVFGEMPDELTDREFRDRLSVYEMVAIEKEFPAFVSKISGLSYDENRRENVSAYHFDISVFQEKPLADFVEANHAADLALYEFLSSRQ